MQTRTASIGENTAFPSRPLREYLKIRCRFRTWIAPSMMSSAGIRSARQAASCSYWWFIRARINMAKKKSALSRQERRVPANALFTTPISDKERRQLQRLARKPDARIDFSDAPERKPLPSDVHVGRFYRPIKQLVSLRVDADVLAWFRGRGKRYQTYMNEVLRREMQAAPRPR